MGTMKAMDRWITDHPSTQARDDSEDFLCEGERGCGRLLSPDEATDGRRCSYCRNEDLSYTGPRDEEDR